MCVEQKNLGCMNGWYNGKPAAYVEHLEKCGIEYEYKYSLGRDNFEMRKARNYPMIVTNLGRCYNRYSCEQCGCTWTVDSSD